MRHRVICIGGPTGAGKDTLAGIFLKQHPQFVRIPRSTTRPPRPNEIHGYHYRFLSEEEFIFRQMSGVLCGIDHFCGYRYGIDNHLALDVLAEGKNVLGVFGIRGLELRPLLPEAMVSVYVTAPLAILNEHLIKRGDPPEEISVRITAAEKQIADELHLFDHVVHNAGTIQDAFASFVRILSHP